MQPKTKILAYSLSLIFLLSVAGYFFSRYEVHFYSPIALRNPIQIIQRAFAYNVTIVQASTNNNPLTPDQQFACNLFGKDCVTALSIMRAESHDRHDAININKNGTADLGCWQINTVHLAQIDTKNLNLLNCQDNTKAAFTLYKQQKGFSAWVTFTSGEYKQYLIN